ncbi:MULTISPECIES: Uma2 family endonuclease [Saccharopolyspora]|uniref:Uma2 family endonuclease n=1 Tax=Saccharopolyspora elongata TaxID=2530387 RepID=A0A4R4ZAN9_9PSEU|nr:Uma2 family endonuclease [Saccharopolyspora elongata]TDD54870.1 Uma2 family endonuclease [Saccharopolyspora elongata]
MSLAHAVPAALGPHTVSEWHEMPQPGNGRRLELLAGWLIMSPAPTRRHQRIGDLVRTVLEDTFPENLAVTAAAVDVSTPRRDGLIPDVMLMTHDTDDDPARAEDVLLVVEVWSDGNTARERVEKRHAYATAGIPFLWEITFDATTAELVGQRNDHGRWLELDRLPLGPDPIAVTAAPKPLTLALT